MGGVTAHTVPVTELMVVMTFGVVVVIVVRSMVMPG